VPLVESVGGVVFFDERFTLFQAAGAGLILAGASLALRR
jgi:drug/metabolite transporter (DMT)-like permease